MPNPVGRPRKYKTDEDIVKHYDEYKEIIKQKSKEHIDKVKKGLEEQVKQLKEKYPNSQCKATQKGISLFISLLDLDKI